MKSGATTVEGYLRRLPPERQSIIEEVRRTILRHLPEGYRETMSWGIITYEVPLERYPSTYNKQPLGYAGLASQKNYCALYLLGVYQDSDAEKRLRQGFRDAGKKLDMGKSCIRFTRVDDLPLDVIGEVIAGTSVDDFIATYEASRTGKSGR